MVSTGFNASRGEKATSIVLDVNMSQLSKRHDSKRHDSKRHDETMRRGHVWIRRGSDKSLGGMYARRNVTRHMDQTEITVRSSIAYTRTKPPSFAMVTTQPVKFLGIILRRSQLRSPYIQQQARQVYRLRLFLAPSHRLILVERSIRHQQKARPPTPICIARTRPNGSTRRRSAQRCLTVLTMDLVERSTWTSIG